MNPIVSKRDSAGTASVVSGISSICPEDPRAEDLTDDELKIAITNIEKSVQLLSLENEVLERFLYHIDPNLASDAQRLLEQISSGSSATSRHPTGSLTITSQPSQASVRDFDLSMSSLRPSVMRFGGNYLDRGPRINILQKMEIVAREIEELQNELTEQQETSKRIHFSLKAQLEQLRLMVKDIEEVGVQLETILKTDVDPLTGRLPAERFLRYLDEWLKKVDSITEKLRLRCSSLRIQNLRAQQQLEQKAELGETLHPVDFEQLKIENKEFLEKLDQKNRNVLEMKKIAGKSALLLNNNKKSLMEQVAELAKLRETMKKYEKQLEDFAKESDQVEMEVEKAEEEYTTIKDLVTNYRAPDVIEYIKKKAELADLKKAIKVWGHRKTIQETALRFCIRNLLKMPHGAEAWHNSHLGKQPSIASNNSDSEVSYDSLVTCD